MNTFRSFHHVLVRKLVLRNVMFVGNIRYTMVHISCLEKGIRLRAVHCSFGGGGGWRGPKKTKKHCHSWETVISPLQQPALGLVPANVSQLLHISSSITGNFLTAMACWYDFLSPPFTPSPSYFLRVSAGFLWFSRIHKQGHLRPGSNRMKSLTLNKFVSVRLKYYWYSNATCLQRLC